MPEMEKMGYKLSKMDPCIMLLHEPTSGDLKGAAAIEVDDLFMVGDEDHQKKMQAMKQKFGFGNWVTLKQSEMGRAFNGRRVRQLPDGEFLVDMQKFIEERLNPVLLEKGRAAQKKEPATEVERDAARATCGLLTWLSKEGRPDAAGPSSLLSSKLTQLKVEDILAMNEVVKSLKANSDLAIRIQPLKSMRFAIATDASFANEGFHSQGGHIVLAHEKVLQTGGKGKANVLLWRSGTYSTLAAETQSLWRGIGDLLWCMVVA